MAIYTVIGCHEQTGEPTFDYFEASIARPTAEAALKRHRRDGDWDFVAAYYDRLLPAAGPLDVAAEPPGEISRPRIEKPFTVFGHWTATHESFSMISPAGTPKEAMTLARAYLVQVNGVQPQQLRLLGCFSGEREPLLARENLPNDWNQPSFARARA